MIKQKEQISEEDRKLLQKTRFRTFSLSSSYNYEKAQGLGFLCAMIPFINHYNKDKEKRISAYQREWTTFNTTPSFGPYITGICAKMEKQAAQDETFPVETIEATKASLMAPVASIGDSLLWSMLRIITLSVGIVFALQGSILGVILHLLLFNIPVSVVRYNSIYIGFTEGTSFMTKVADSHLLEFINKAASILTLIMVGALTCHVVPLSFTSSVSAVLDGIFPYLVPMGLVLLLFRLLKKGIKSNWIVLSLLVLSLIGAFFGLY